jgi:hypothetical protein
MKGLANRPQTGMASLEAYLCDRNLGPGLIPAPNQEAMAIGGLGAFDQGMPFLAAHVWDVHHREGVIRDHLHGRTRRQFGQRLARHQRRQGAFQST